MCSDCPGGMNQVERTLAGNMRKGHHSQRSQYKQARFRQITESYTVVLHLEHGPGAVTQLLTSGGVRQFPAGLRRNLSPQRHYCLFKTSERLEPDQPLKRIQDFVPWGTHFTNGRGKKATQTYKYVSNNVWIRAQLCWKGLVRQRPRNS